MAQQYNEHQNLDASRTRLVELYRYWQSKPSSITSKAVCDLLEDAIEVIEGVIKRARPVEQHTSEGAN